MKHILKRIKQYLVGWLLSKEKIQWKNNGGPKILIQIGKQFNADQWSPVIEKFKSSFVEEPDIVYADGQVKFTKHFNEADYCFCFGLNRYLDLNKTNVKLIFLGLSGLDSVQAQKIPAHIVFHSAAGIASQSIAEYALTFSLLMLNDYHRVVIQSSNQTGYRKSVTVSERNRIIDKTAGVLGVGHNGKATAKLFSGVARAVYGCDNQPDHGLEWVDKWFKPEELINFISSIDILIICLPLTQNTKNLINLELLKNAGKQLILINTSRGKIVDENDLFLALKKRMIRSAVLDTTVIEPYPIRGKLRQLDNLIITPHVSGNINFFREQIAEKFIGDVLKMIP